MLSTLANEVEKLIVQSREDGNVSSAASILLGLAVSRIVHQNSSLSRWQNNRSTIPGAFGKQALQIGSTACNQTPFHLDQEAGMVQLIGSIE